MLAGIHFAQSEYAAAQAILLRCIEQEATVPAPLPHSPQRHTIVKTHTTPTAAAEVYNPWSTFSNTTTTTVTSSDGSAAKVAPSLVHPSATYLDDLNNEMLGTMVSFCFLSQAQAKSLLTLKLLLFYPTYTDSLQLVHFEG